MQNQFDDWLHMAKHVFAGAIFVLLVIGGCAAVFSAIAAGINGLNNLDARQPQTTVTISVPAGTSNANGSSVTDLQPGQALSPPVEYPNTPVIPAPSTSTGATGADQNVMNSEVAHLTSPVGDAIDSSGIIIGNRLQQTFGSLLKGLLEALFVEQTTSVTETGAGQ